MSERRDWKFLAVLIGLTVLSWWPQRQGPIDARSDGAIYYILGTSLAQGHGYRLLNEPGDVRAVQYPPLLPLLVAAHQKVLGTTDFVVVGRWLRGFYFVVSLVLAVVGYRLARQYLPPGRALLAGVVSGLAFHIWYLAGILYGEIPLALLTVLFVACARKSDRPGHWLLTAALGVAAYFLRTAGIALLAAWAAQALLDRDRAARARCKQAVPRAAVALCAVIAWQAYVGSVTSSPEYRRPVYPYQRAAYQYSNVTYADSALYSPFQPEEGRITTRGRVRRFLENAAVIIPSVGGAVTAQRTFWEVTIRSLNRHAGREVVPESAALVPMTGIGLVILAGAVLMLRRRQVMIPICCAAAAGVMCLTPWPEQFVRYFSPMIPLLSIMLVTGLGAACDGTSAIGSGPRGPGARRVGTGLAIGVLVVVLLEDGFVAWRTLVDQAGRPIAYHDAAGRPTSGRLLFYDASAAALDDALNQVRERATVGDVVATTMPHWAYLRTGVKSILPPMETNRDEARRLLDAVPVRFVVLDELLYPRISQRYAAPAVEGRPTQWRLVYRTADGNARVYERAR